MSKIKDDTVGGFNTFLDDQKNEKGTATVSLYDFNTNVERVYEGYPIEDAPQLRDDDYTPAGQTALHDALYTAVTETADYVGQFEESEQPDTVIVVILTDGKENASETHQEQVREQIKIRSKDHGWEFLFIGANQDAALTANKVGIDPDRSLDMAHSGDGAEAAYKSTSDRVSQARREGSTGEFSDEDRHRQDEA